MDITFEQTGWAKALVKTGGRGDCPHPEWHALRARMIASHEAWRALEMRRSDEAGIAIGSFDGRAARLICDFEAGLGRVNPIDSVNRNPDGDIHMVVAGTSRTGNRG
jgi:hypothetical protein